MRKTDCDTLQKLCQYAAVPDGECNGEGAEGPRAWKPFGNICGTPGPFATRTKPGSKIKATIGPLHFQTKDFLGGGGGAKAVTGVRLVRLVAGEPVETLIETSFAFTFPSEEETTLFELPATSVEFERTPESSYQWQLRYDCKPGEYTGYEFTQTEDGKICWEYEPKNCALELLEAHPCLHEKLCFEPKEVKLEVEIANAFSVGTGSFHFFPIGKVIVCEGTSTCGTFSPEEAGNYESDITCCFSSDSSCENNFRCSLTVKVRLVDTEGNVYEEVTVPGGPWASKGESKVPVVITGVKFNHPKGSTRKYNWQFEGNVGPPPEGEEPCCGQFDVNGGSCPGFEGGGGGPIVFRKE